MAKGKFGEPWRLQVAYDGKRDLTHIINSDGGGFVCELLDDEEGNEYAARIQSCVNALDGMNPDALKGLVEEIKYSLSYFCDECPGLSEGCKEAAKRFDCRLHGIRTALDALEAKE